MLENGFLWAFQDNFLVKTWGERKPLKERILKFRQHRKPWFSLTSAEVDSASEWIRANGFREDYIEGKDDFAVKRHTREGTKPRSILDYFSTTFFPLYFVAVSKMYSICPVLGNPYGFGICMNAILQMHISRVSTHKIWSSSGGPKRLLLQILCWRIVSLDYPISFGLVIIQG